MLGMAALQRYFSLQLRRMSADMSTKSKIKPPTYQKKNKFDAGKWLMLGIPITTFCLGTLQVRRRSWKNELIERINRRTTGPPRVLPQDIHNVDWKELEYSKFIVIGEFDHSKELYVQPRTIVMPKDRGGGGALISTSPKGGAHVITPLYIPEWGYCVLVNRGFVDRDRIDPLTRASGQVVGEKTITGILRLTEHNKMMPTNNPEHNLWGTVDVEKMAEVTGAEPILLDATADSTVPGGPVGGQTRIRPWNQHFSYVITWYSLSALTFFAWISKYLK